MNRSGPARSFASLINACSSPSPFERDTARRTALSDKSVLVDARRGQRFTGSPEKNCEDTACVHKHWRTCIYLGLRRGRTAMASLQPPRGIYRDRIYWNRPLFNQRPVCNSHRCMSLVFVRMYYIWINHRLVPTAVSQAILQPRIITLCTRGTLSGVYKW